MRFRDLVRWVRLVPGRAQAQADLDDEIRLHLDLIERQLRERGLDADAARAEARRRFGNPSLVGEDARDAFGLRWLDDLRHDAAHAARTLTKDRRFAASALVTLALGIGATTAIFSAVSSLVFRPLPFPEPDRLVQMVGTSPLRDGDSVANAGLIREQSSSFAASAGYEVTARYMRRSDGTQRVMAVQTERPFFAMLGTPPLRGRMFAAEDPAAVAVVSERFWRDALDAREDAIGSAIDLDGDPVTIIGVMPAGFQFPYGAASLLPGVASETRTDLWMPFRTPPNPRGRLTHVTARLTPGVTVAQAQNEMDVITGRLATEDPQRNHGRGVRLVPLARAVVSPAIRRALFLLFGAVGLVLALACVNVTNLSLARAAARRRDVAIRAALGAGRGRLVRQFLAESLVLSLAGGALGLVLAWIATHALLSAIAPFVPRAQEIGIDWRVFVFLFVLCSAVAVGVGLVPALLATRTDTRAALEQGGDRSTLGGRQRWIRDGLVVAEVALALVLAAGSSVLIRELVRLRRVETGMVTQNVLTAHIGHRMTPRGTARPFDEDVRPFYEIEARAAQLPGVRAAGLTQLLPLQSWGWWTVSNDFRVRGEAPPSTPPFAIELRFVTPGYFAALGIPIVRGRGFTASDDREAPAVLMINEALARRMFGGRDPIGMGTTRATIVGVVRDVRQVHLDRAAEPEIYTPIAQNWSQVGELGMTLVASTRQNPESLAAGIRAIVREVSPDLAVFNVKSMEQVIDDSLADFTLYLSLIAAFAALALVLAATGTYGVISCVALSRGREFAIRAALGASRGRLAALVVRDGLLFGAIGAVLGTLGALAAAPLLRNLPVTIHPPDAATIAPAALLLAALAVAASLAPARRASTADPMQALRNE
jgi:putative ABC transport system permease protein